MIIKIKPLSVNEAWQGRKNKTKKYDDYEELLINNLLPNNYLLNYNSLNIEFGFSSRASDLDNPLKPLIDILQKKYNFNDNKIYELEVTKEIVKKGEEYIKVNDLFIQTKPLSYNEMYKGRKTKTKKYRSYSKKFNLLSCKYFKKYFKSLNIEFGFSSKASDIDNPLKPLLDLMQKKYNFNDNEIYHLKLKKEIVKKGEEYIKII